MLYIESHNNSFNAPWMDMGIAVKIIYDFFRVDQVRMVWTVNIRFKEAVDNSIPAAITVTTMIFMPDGKVFPTIASDWDRRRWLIPVPDSVDRDHDLSEFFACHLHILGWVSSGDIGKDRLNNLSRQRKKSRCLYLNHFENTVATVGGGLLVPVDVNKKQRREGDGWT